MARVPHAISRTFYPNFFHVMDKKSVSANSGAKLSEKSAKRQIVDA